MAGMEGDFPVVARQETVARRFFLEPRIAEQDAHGLFWHRAEPGKNDSRVRLAKLVVGDLQRVLVRRREFGLETETEAARHRVRTLDAQVLEKTPERFGRQRVAGETVLPGAQRFVQRRADEIIFFSFALGWPLFFPNRKK